MDLRIKHLAIFSILLTMSFHSIAQNVDRLIDSTDIKRILSQFDDFVNSVDSLHEKKDDLQVFFIYETHLLDDDIEESKISQKYYLSGEFLEDLVELQTLQRNSYKRGYGYYFDHYHVVVFDSLTDKVYQYASNNRLHEYFYSDEPFYHYIAKLYKNEQIDCAFFYPTVIHHPSIIHRHYSRLMYLAFAVKNREFYVIRDGKAPGLYSLEDYINCCWDEMIGIEK